MSRFSGKQYKGAQRDHRTHVREDAERRAAEYRRLNEEKDRMAAREEAASRQHAIDQSMAVMAEAGKAIAAVKDRTTKPRRATRP